MNVLVGIALLARGRAEGLAQFEDSVQAFLASLAPLIAFPLVRGVIAFSEGETVGTVTDLLATLCALIAPAVIPRHWPDFGIAKRDGYATPSPSIGANGQSSGLRRCCC